MKEIKVQVPAKINLSLDVINKREDGFHNIESIMQAINLYDYLTVKIEETDGIEIELCGNSQEIPYDKMNLVWKAAEKFFEAAKITNCKLTAEIEKHIPVAAGLAGGSADAAAVIFALNTLYDFILDDKQINEICAALGSDVNFCLNGGCAICTSRGEEIFPIPFFESPVSIVKPKNIKIRAKEAFEEYDFQTDIECKYSTRALIPLIVRGYFDEKLIHNDLEMPIIKKYNVLKNIKNFVKDSHMSGSGPIFYTFSKEFDVLFEPEEFTFFENLKTIPDGIKIVKRG